MLRADDDETDDDDNEPLVDTTQPLMQQEEGILEEGDNFLQPSTRREVVATAASSLSERGLAIVESAARGAKRSDSILSMDEDDEEDDEEEEEEEEHQHHHHRYRRKSRAASMQYIEDASMEALLFPVISSSEDTGDSSGRSYTKIMPSGRLGRRRTNTDSDVIVVDNSDLEGYFLDEGRETMSESDMDRTDQSSSMSERGVFSSSLNRKSLKESLDVQESIDEEKPAAADVAKPADVAVPSANVKPPPIRSLGGSALETLQAHGILPQEKSEKRKSVHDQATEEAMALHALFDDACIPAVEFASVHSILHRDYYTGQSIPLPEQPVIKVGEKDNWLVLLLTAGTPAKPALFQLPGYFAEAFLRILVRILTNETDAEYNEACFLTMSWESPNRPPIDISEDNTGSSHRDQTASRSNLFYSVARLQCNENWSTGRAKENERPAVSTILNLWERAAEKKEYHHLVAPIARLLGLFGVASVTPRILRRMLSLAQTSSLTPKARLAMVRALRTAAAGASRSYVLPKSPPRHFFSFGGRGLERTISGLSVWPFRNDFGMATWFRAERFDPSAYPTLLAARTDDGGGVEVSLVPLEAQSSDACTVAVSIFDSGHEAPVHHLKVKGCVLLPRVWYHLAVRHTRSRLKGVFSLSTRQQLSIMLDGKIMLTESLHFPQVSDADFKDESLIHAGLRRVRPHSNFNLTLKFGSHFDGQTAAMYIFNDNVSDASFRALYEETGGRGGALRKESSLGREWDARRSDIVRKSRVLDVSMTNEDAEEIVLSQRRRSSSRRREKYQAIVDLGEGEEQEETDLPADLQKAAFASKVFVVWDPRRTLEALALELHVGAHLNLESVHRWSSNGAQDVITSVGGVQSLVPLFRSLTVGEIERSLSVRNLTTREGKGSQLERDPSLPVISELFLLLAAFVQDHDENARELLRCGGIDIIEQVLYTSKKSSVNKQSLFAIVSKHSGLASLLVDALLKLRSACGHYVGLETKVYSRLLFNTSLWLGNFEQTPGVSFHMVLLPVLSSLTKMTPGKVRDCVGIKEMVEVLKDYMAKEEEDAIARELSDRFHQIEGSVDSPLVAVERRHATNILFGMIFEVLSSGTCPHDFAPFLHLISLNLDWDDGKLSISRKRENRRQMTINACTVLLFLLKIRPVVSGLYESFAHCCGSIQGGVAWLLSALVNSPDDGIRSLGVRCVTAYLDVTSKSEDTPLSFGTTTPSSEPENPQGPDVPSSSRRTRVAILAKGLVAMGTGVRSIVLPPSKLTARVVFKLLWHLLKSHRSDLGDKTWAALLSCITEDNGIVSSSLTKVDFLQRYLIEVDETSQPGFCLSVQWAETILAETGNIVGRSLRNPLAIGAVLRLIRYLEGPTKDEWLADILTLVNSSRKSVSMLSSLSDWQPCLFHLTSETLELLNTLREDSLESRRLQHEDLIQKQEKVRADSVESQSSVGRRLDRCLELYSTLLGHLVREGGDKALDAVENAASLQRVCVNGHDVLLLVLSALCANLFEHGTLFEVGSISAQDWKDVNLEQDSLLLKQSAKLVTNAILSNGTKGLDMTSAVRSWRSLRHLTEIVVAVVTKCHFGIVDLFDYVNQRAAAVDAVSGGLHGIRLPDSRLTRVGASEYLLFARGVWTMSSRSEPDEDHATDVDRRLCVTLAAQVLALLDAFIFPDSLDSSLPASQLHGLALVRNSEPRLGTSQGPLVSSAIRLSLLLLALLEPCSIKFLQCASRLRCLLYWALELIRESAALEGTREDSQDSVAAIDRLILAVVLHCHRSLGRCSALLVEIESSSYDKYFQSREEQRKHFRRLMRVGLELRDVVSTAFRGRNDFLRATLSTEAYDDLAASLEGASSSRQAGTKDIVVREFLTSRWVAKYQDVESRADLSVPEQVSMDTIPLSSDQETHPLIQGFLTVERLAQESSSITADFEKALNECFERYLEAQRKWAETDAVRDLEYEGDITVRRLSDKSESDTTGHAKTIALRRSGADFRWRGVQRKAVYPWKNEAHWKLGRYTDQLGRRILLVQNREFDAHKDASYDQTTGKQNEEEETRLSWLEEEKQLSDVMRRNAEAFVPAESSNDSDSLEDDSHQVSEGDSSTGVDSSADGDSVDQTGADEMEMEGLFEQEEEWDKIETEEYEHVNAEGDGDGWAKGFIWMENESVVARFEPVMIVSLQSFVEGKILLTTHGLYFKQLGEATNVMTREFMEDPESAGDRRWRLSRLTEIHGRRYMLRPQALELFFSDSHELFLNFPGGTKERDRFHAKMRNSCKVPMLWSPKSLNPRVVFRKSKITELWKKRRISNFEYLMALNRMAGRSFNDITQYPVFPWVLADFTSENIDLGDSRVFRDLSKPIGALNPNRLAQLLERYKDLDLCGFPETEKFLYGSHYSSPGIVLHYLVRQEPFTTMAIQLQSGRFDCPDRLFFDIAGSWNSCMTSSSDMKELIPEFYCLPDMFLNSNGFPLGRTQSGRIIDNVGMPPWAKGSAHEFVRIQRLALESEYVSQNLHHWIDLIFGFKQRGPEAEAAHNVFHHLSYEGSVDLDKIVDDVDRKAAESHIQNFGQTPSQLSVVDPHPTRYTADECWKPLIYNFAVPKQLRCHTPAKQFGNKRSENAKGAVLKIHVLSDTIVAIYGDASVGTYRWLPGRKGNRLRIDKLRPVARSGLSTSRVAMKRGSAVPADVMDESSLAISSSSFAITIGGRVKEELRRKAVFPSSRLMTSAEPTLATAEASALLVSCGYWDNAVKVHGADALRLLASENGGHRGPIQCLAMGKDGGLMVTGGQDGTCRVWVVGHTDMGIALSDGYVQTALGGSADGEDEQLLRCCHVVWGQDTPIMCVDIDSDLDVFVSGSQAGLVCIHTLRRGEFVRSFRPPVLTSQANDVAVSKLALDSTGSLVVHMADGELHTFTVNSHRLCSTDAGEKLFDMRICSSGEMLVTGGDRCQVVIRKVVDLQVCAMLDLTRHGPIRCIALTPDDLNPINQYLFIGSDDGMITVVGRDPLISTEKDSETITL